MSHTINWFEIPVTDLNRAMSFYSKVLGVDITREEMDGCKMGIFPGSGGNVTEKNIVHGALVQADGYIPSTQGSLLYLNGGDDLSTPLAKIKAAGGEVLQEKTAIGPHGFFAIFKDTEGNKVALHSPH